MSLDHFCHFCSGQLFLAFPALVSCTSTLKIFIMERYGLMVLEYHGHRDISHYLSNILMTTLMKGLLVQLL
jgi:hypothetical protein